MPSYNNALVLVALSATVLYAPTVAETRDTKPCNLGVCPSGYTCREADKHCVGIGGKELEIIGECVNLLCPETYACMEGVCIRAPLRKIAGSVAIGPCVNLKCPADHICEKEECFPIDKNVTAINAF